MKPKPGGWFSRIQNICRRGFHSGITYIAFSKTTDGTKISTAIENPIWPKAAQRD
jgi:hypothetical protein